MAAKTGFDRYLDQRLADPAFRRDYQAARAGIDATDALIRALEAARARKGLSKAELARRLEVKPEIVRRLLTDEDGNPTIGTVLKLAAALGCHLELVPDEAGATAGPPPPPQLPGMATSRRISASGPGTRRRAAAPARSRAR